MSEPSDATAAETPASAVPPPALPGIDYFPTGSSPRMTGVRRLIEQVAARAPISLRMGHDEPGRPGVDDWTRDSDHFVFHERGIPFIYFGVEDYAHHHKATDDYETMTLDFYVGAVSTIIDATGVLAANLKAIAAGRASR